MRSCPACGAANREDDEFCGNCGSYLGWSSRQPDSTPAAAPEPTEPTEPTAPETGPPSGPAPGPAPGPATGPATGRAGGPVSGAVTGSVPERAPEPPPPVPEPPAAPARTRAPEPAEPSPPASAPPPAPAPEPAAPAPEAAPPAPVRPARPVAGPPEPPAPRPAAPQEPVGAVQPARPVARRPVVRPVAADEVPDGPPCPACGTPNLPDRRFCRRCAAPLQVREEAAPLPWWRTVWPFRRRVRSGSGRLLRRTVLALVVVGLLCAGFLLVPAGRYVYEDVRDKLGKTAEISPRKATASADTPGHPASAAIDGMTNQYWAAPALGSSLTCTFAEPFRLVGVVIYPGVSTKAAEFRRSGRPTEAELVITNADGDTTTKKVKLNDKPGQFTVRTGISDVVSVRLVLKAAAGQDEGPIAVGEVEFYRRA
ncbi:zinc-ribbon domain-containing protein [Streptomyces sp. NPDC058195]|uniref:NADase-type glycan-binding domain-containing protein n=1 Tax=Streptomyces sp. NPDC058195 TaxID=3346375 RepID=UPI0036E10257